MLGWEAPLNADGWLGRRVAVGSFFPGRWHRVTSDQTLSMSCKPLLRHQVLWAYQSLPFLVACPMEKASLVN